jgi:hypothetical protein
VFLSKRWITSKMLIATFLTAEFRVESKVSPYGLYAKQSGTGASSSPSISDLSHQWPLLIYDLILEQQVYL